MPRSGRMKLLVTGFWISLALILTGCTGAASEPPPPPTLAATGDPQPVMSGDKMAGPRGTTLRGRGVTVEVPRGAVPDGHEFGLSVGHPIGLVERPGTAEIFGAPVAVEYGTPLAAPARIEWDIADLPDEQRSTLVLARWDDTLQVWRATDEPFQIDGSKLSAEITEFSFLTWVANAAATVTQTAGEWSGKRSDALECTSDPLPSWVSDVIRPDADQPAMPIRTCTEPDKGNVLTLRVANNRPYSQQLDLTKGDGYAWAWRGDADGTVEGILRELAGRALATPTNMQMAPTRATAVGLAQPGTPGQVELALAAHPTISSIGTDVLIALIGSVVDLDNVGGFDSDALNAFVQAIYDCGGKDALKSREVASADTFQRVLETTRSCVDSDAVMSAIEDVLRAQIAKGGESATKAIQTNRLLKGALGKIGTYLTVTDFASYTAELTSAGAVGDVKINVRGYGPDPELGDWTASCSEPAADWDLLFKNLAEREAFRDTSKEYWEFPAWKKSATTAVQPVKKCSRDYAQKLAAEVGQWTDQKSAEAVVSAIKPCTTRARSSSSSPAASGRSSSAPRRRTCARCSTPFSARPSSTRAQGAAKRRPSGTSRTPSTGTCRSGSRARTTPRSHRARWRPGCSRPRPGRRGR